MLSPDDNSGLFTFLVGLIILVMAGVGLSIVIDNRFKWSAAKGDIETQIAADAQELSSLKSNHERNSGLLVELTAKSKELNKEQLTATTGAKILSQRMAELGEAKIRLTEETAALENRFKDYRSKYRQITWNGAVGEKLGDVSLSGGREYRDCSITKVTDVGLEIRHEHGFARIQGPDLDRKLQDRFQWDDEARRKRLNEELELHDELAGNDGKGDSPDDGGTGRSSPVRDALTLKREARAEERAKIQELREQVRGWQMKVMKINGEVKTAESNARYGNRGSVPGSLETWKNRAARLRGEVVKARTELEVSRSKLRMLAPRDPLLEVNADGE